MSDAFTQYLTAFETHKQALKDLEKKTTVAFPQGQRVQCDLGRKIFTGKVLGYGGFGCIVVTDDATGRGHWMYPNKTPPVILPEINAEEEA